jgi:carbohydrate-selective porin OprB
MRTVMQDFCRRMKKNGKNHGRNPNWGSTSLINSIEKKKTSPRLVKQALQRPQERNKGHLKLRGRKREKRRGRGSPRPKNKPIVV